MSQHERLTKLRHFLDSVQGVSRASLLQTLGVSSATLKRDLAYLRDRLNLPAVFDHALGTYRIDARQALSGTQYELPGLWFNADEVHALLTMQHLLAHLDTGGLLGPHIAPLAERLAKLLDIGAPKSARGGAKGRTVTGPISALQEGTRSATMRAEIRRRIHVQTVGARQVHLPHFQAVGTALLRRQRLHLSYHGRGRDERRERDVSPQRLIHYRDNWYLDAWCHWRRALRSFAVDAIVAAAVLDQTAIDVAEQELDAVLGAGYGIFAGREVQWATLRFSAERARWVAAEAWHPAQRGHFDEQGRYVLELPYADPRELVMDVLRHVPHVAVIGPESLRAEVEEKLRAGLSGITG